MLLLESHVAGSELFAFIPVQVYAFPMENERSSTLIARARRESGLTQSAFASRAGTSQPAIARYEAGLASPSIDTLARILKAGGLELVLRVNATRVVNLSSKRAKKIRENRGEINRLMKLAGASHVRIFGSVVRGEDRQSSDIDFLVEFDTSQGLVPLMKLKTQLSALLKEKVDVAPVSILKKSVLEEALKEAIPL
jgi:predicted nucleotidyltransferase/DNA-binding XRE family transcriptional regulator